MENKNDPKTIDLLDEQEDLQPSELSLLWVNQDELTFIPFTTKANEVQIHWADEVDIRGFFLCNGADCYYCKIGKKPTSTFLIPVYLPISDSIGILPVNNTKRPGTLLPQLKLLLRTPRKLVIGVSKKDGKFFLNSNELPEIVEDGSKTIKRFLDSQPEDSLDLPDLYPSISNEALLEVPEVERALKIKGLIK